MTMSGFTINTVALSGNLTRDPEFRTTGGGTEVCQLRIAVNERVKQGDQWGDRPNYFDVTLFGGLGGWLAKNIRKGDGIAVQGRLRWHEWEAKDGGGKRQAVEVIADSVVPVPRDGAPRSSGNGGGGQRQAAGAPAGGGGDFERPLPGADDDIPF